MEDQSDKKILQNNINLLSTNIKKLMQIRPNWYIQFKQNIRGPFSYNVINKKFSNICEYEDEKEILIAINTSILLHCFGLFEACFEWNLLMKYLNRYTEKEDKSKIEKEIKRIIKISSLENYLKEYKKLNCTNFNKTLDINEQKEFSIIKAFYCLRHLLAHGSALEKAMIKSKSKGWHIEFDKNYEEYQNLIRLIKDSIDIEVNNENLDIEILLLINQVIDLLIQATSIISAKLFGSGNKYLIYMDN